MQYGWARRIAVVASILAFGTVIISVAAGMYKISSLQNAYSEQRRLAECTNLSQTMIDDINHIIIGFTSIALDLQPDERARLVGSADQKFREFDNSVPRLIASSEKFLTKEKREQMAAAIASVVHAWEEIRRQSGNDMSDDEKAHHFLQMYENLMRVRDALREVETATVAALDSISLSVRAELKAVAWMLVWAMLFGAAVSIAACLGTLHFSHVMKRVGRTLRERDEEVVEKSRRLNVALDNMAHGLCVFGQDRRLVVCNSQYAMMYGLDPGLVKEGTSLRSILESIGASGNGLASERAYIENGLADSGIRKPQTVVHSRKGRVFEILYQPLPDGGWVEIHQDITEKRRAEEKIAHLAHHDALTGLPNRMFFREQLDLQLRHVKGSRSLAVLCLDLDCFKQVNDTLGHPVGDALLCAVSGRLRECVRDTDVVARLGGDEFAIILTGVEQPTSARVLAQRLVEETAKPFDAEGYEVVVGTSVGISIAPSDGTNADELLRNADMALYRAKENGRNGFCFFEVGMDAKMQERRLLELELRKALMADEFELFYQPIVNLEQNTITCFEALLRWNHRTKGVVPPATFIPLAEETGLIIPIGEWVLRQACVEASRWPHDIKVAVNLSPVQFRSKSLYSDIVSAIAAAGIAACRLDIEITEAVLLQNNEATLTTLHQLRDLGVRISIDDFGTGYSSLSYLRSFPFDRIKIDQSFVRDLEHNRDGIAIIRAVSGIGMSLGMMTMVEGVETKAQLDQVRAEGCTEAQGYIFGRPQPASEVPRMLAGFARTCEAAA